MAKKVCCGQCKSGECGKHLNTCQKSFPLELCMSLTLISQPACIKHLKINNSNFLQPFLPVPWDFLAQRHG